MGSGGEGKQEAGGQSQVFHLDEHIEYSFREFW
jgi:hypothetical protein